MRAENRSRVITLLSIIGSFLANPLPDRLDEYRASKRELHFMRGANPIFTPKHQKRKGYKKDAMRDNRYNKFRKYK